MEVTIEKTVDFKLVKSLEEISQRRQALYLVVSVPVYYDEDKDLTLISIGTDGNFTIHRDAIEEAGFKVDGWLEEI